MFGNGSGIGSHLGGAGFWPWQCSRCIAACGSCPRATAVLIERLGQGTAEPSTPVCTSWCPSLDRVRAVVDLREQVVSFPPQAGDHGRQPRRQHRHRDLLPADRPEVRGLRESTTTFQGIEQLTVTTLRNVIGSLDSRADPDQPPTSIKRPVCVEVARRRHWRAGASGSTGSN